MEGDWSDHVPELLARLDRLSQALLLTADEVETLAPVIRAHDEPDAKRNELFASARTATEMRVRRIIASFGTLWQCRTPGEIDNYVRRCGDDCRMILLFEVLHEGAATSAMKAAARLVGIDSEFDRIAGELLPVPKADHADDGGERSAGVRGKKKWAAQDSNL